VGVYTSAFILRSNVWQTIFKKMDENPPFNRVFFAIGIDWMANNFIPGKIGDLIGIEVITKGANLKYGKSFGSIAIIRLFDIITLFLLSLIGLGIIEISLFQLGLANPITSDPDVLISVIVSLILIIAICLSLLIIFKYPEKIEKIGGKISPKFGLFIANLINPLKQGLSFFISQPKRGRFFFRILLEDFIVWILDASPIALLCIFMKLTLNPFIAIICILITFILLPIPSTPSSWGVSETVWTTLMLIFSSGYSFSFLISIFLIDHLLRYVYVICYGFIALPRMNYHFRSLNSVKSENEDLSKNHEIPPNDSND
jgi:hypothetical protein